MDTISDDEDENDEVQAKLEEPQARGSSKAKSVPLEDSAKTSGGGKAKSVLTQADTAGPSPLSSGRAMTDKELQLELLAFQAVEEAESKRVNDRAVERELGVESMGWPGDDSAKTSNGDLECPPAIARPPMIRSLPEQGFSVSEFLSSPRPMLEIIVGTDASYLNEGWYIEGKLATGQQTYHIHQFMLEYASYYFPEVLKIPPIIRNCQSDSNKLRPSVIELPDVDPHMFGFLVQYLYCGQIKHRMFPHWGPSGEEPCGDCGWETDTTMYHSIKLWLLAENLEIPSLMDYATWCIMTIYDFDDSCRIMNTWWKAAIGACNEDTLLWKMLVDLFAWDDDLSDMLGKYVHWHFRHPGRLQPCHPSHIIEEPATQLPKAGEWILNKRLEGIWDNTLQSFNDWVKREREHVEHIQSTAPTLAHSFQHCPYYDIRNYYETALEDPYLPHDDYRRPIVHPSNPDAHLAELILRTRDELGESSLHRYFADSLHFLQGVTTAGLKGLACNELRPERPSPSQVKKEEEMREAKLKEEEEMREAKLKEEEERRKEQWRATTDERFIRKIAEMDARYFAQIEAQEAKWKAEGKNKDGHTPAEVEAIAAEKERNNRRKSNRSRMQNDSDRLRKQYQQAKESAHKDGGKEEKNIKTILTDKARAQQENSRKDELEFDRLGAMLPRAIRLGRPRFRHFNPYEDILAGRIGPKEEPPDPRDRPKIVAGGIYWLKPAAQKRINAELRAKDERNEWLRSIEIADCCKGPGPCTGEVPDGVQTTFRDEKGIPIMPKATTPISSIPERPGSTTPRASQKRPPPSEAAVERSMGYARRGGGGAAASTSRSATPTLTPAATTSSALTSSSASAPLTADHPTPPAPSAKPGPTLPAPLAKPGPAPVAPWAKPATAPPAPTAKSGPITPALLGKPGPAPVAPRAKSGPTPVAPWASNGVAVATSAGPSAATTPANPEEDGFQSAGDFAAKMEKETKSTGDSSKGGGRSAAARRGRDSDRPGSITPRASQPRPGQEKTPSLASAAPTTQAVPAVAVAAAPAPPNTDNSTSTAANNASGSNRRGSDRDGGKGGRVASSGRGRGANRLESTTPHETQPRPTSATSAAPTTETAPAPPDTAASAPTSSTGSNSPSRSSSMSGPKDKTSDRGMGSASRGAKGKEAAIPSHACQHGKPATSAPVEKPSPKPVSTGTPAAAPAPDTKRASPAAAPKVTPDSKPVSMSGPAEASGGKGMDLASRGVEAKSPGLTGSSPTMMKKGLQASRWADQSPSPSPDADTNKSTPVAASKAMLDSKLVSNPAPTKATGGKGMDLASRGEKNEEALPQSTALKQAKPTPMSMPVENPSPKPVSTETPAAAPAPDTKKASPAPAPKATPDSQPVSTPGPAEPSDGKGMGSASRGGKDGEKSPASSPPAAVPATQQAKPTPTPAPAACPAPTATSAAKPTPPAKATTTSMFNLAPPAPWATGKPVTAATPATAPATPPPADSRSQSAGDSAAKKVEESGSWRGGIGNKGVSKEGGGGGSSTTSTDRPGSTTPSSPSGEKKRVHWNKDVEDSEKARASQSRPERATTLATSAAPPTQTSSVDAAIAAALADRNKRTTPVEAAVSIALAAAVANLEAEAAASTATSSDRDAGSDRGGSRRGGRGGRGRGRGRGRGHGCGRG